MKLLWEKIYNDLATHVAEALREARVRPEQIPFKSDGELLTIPGIKDVDVESIRTLYNKDNIVTIKKLVAEASVEEDYATEEVAEEGEEVVKTVKKARPAKVRSAKYLRMAKAVAKDTTHSVKEAVEILAALTKSTKLKTVELTLNTREASLRGEVRLPHSTGKEVRIAIFNDELGAKINAGTIDFDMLLATPADMPKLARFAKVLGPKGLMPNPKNGTVTPDPVKRQAELTAGGTLPYKTEAKAPIIHLNLGPITQPQTDLIENLTETIRSIGSSKIKSAFLSCTHTPSVRLNITAIV